MPPSPINHSTEQHPLLLRLPDSHRESTVRWTELPQHTARHHSCISERCLSCTPRRDPPGTAGLQLPSLTHRPPPPPCSEPGLQRANAGKSPLHLTAAPSQRPPTSHRCPPPGSNTPCTHTPPHAMLSRHPSWPCTALPCSAAYSRVLLLHPTAPPRPPPTSRGHFGRPTSMK